MAAESNEWEIPSLTIRRRPSGRKLGPITQDDYDRLWDLMVKVAHDVGFVIAGVPRPKQTNCPHCGRMVLSPQLKRCGRCGYSFETGKVS